MMTSVGFKVVMAFTGLIFVIFVLFHVYGNLEMFFGPEAYSHYTEWLKHGILCPILPHGWFAWIFRICLVLVLLGHMDAATYPVVRSYRACGTWYEIKSGAKKKESWSSKAIEVGGVAVLLFIVFHILHFTALRIQIEGDYHWLSPYEHMVASFNLDSWVSVCALVVYTVAVTFVGFHVWHGLYPVLITLGAGRRGTEAFLKGLSALYDLILLTGFLAPPFAITFGFIE